MIADVEEADGFRGIQQLLSDQLRALYGASRNDAISMIGIAVGAMAFASA